MFLMCCMITTYRSRVFEVQEPAMLCNEKVRPKKGPLKPPNLILVQYPRGWDLAIGLDPLLIDDWTACCMHEQAASKS